MCNFTPLTILLIITLALAVGAAIALTGLVIGYQVRDEESKSCKSCKCK